MNRLGDAVTRNQQRDLRRPGPESAEMEMRPLRAMTGSIGMGHSTRYGVHPQMRNGEKGAMIALRGM